MDGGNIEPSPQIKQSLATLQSKGSKKEVSFLCPIINSTEFVFTFVFCKEDILLVQNFTKQEQITCKMYAFQIYVSQK